MTSHDISKENGLKVKLVNELNYFSLSFPTILVHPVFLLHGSGLFFTQLTLYCLPFPLLNIANSIQCQRLQFSWVGRGRQVPPALHDGRIEKEYLICVIEWIYKVNMNWFLKHFPKERQIRMEYRRDHGKETGEKVGLWDKPDLSLVLPMLLGVNPMWPCLPQSKEAAIGHCLWAAHWYGTIVVSRGLERNVFSQINKVQSFSQPVTNAHR